MIRGPKSDFLDTLPKKRSLRRLKGWVSVEKRLLDNSASALGNAAAAAFDVTAGKQ